MPPVSFSVTEARVAATCPRILYFDAEATRRKGLKTKASTRIWKEGNAETTACGNLFHQSVEKFNKVAASAVEVRHAIQEGADRDAIEQELLRYFNLSCVNRKLLAQKGVEATQAFIRAVRIYFRELAEILGWAKASGMPVAEIVESMFGDRRRRVDVTFQVGPHGESSHVVGILDYVFHDWRTGHQRIIDYKLTPALEPNNDLFQIALYALMHNVQHRTQPEVGVLYLHPERRMTTMTWPEVEAKRYAVYDLLASMVDWVQYDERRGAGLKPPGEPSACAWCPWDRDSQCVKRLGPKHEGGRHRHWADASSAAPVVTEPVIQVREDEDAPRTQKGQEVVGEGSGEDPPGDRLRLGVGEEGGFAVELPISALPTHVAVVGAAGSGKTWMAKVLVEEAVRLGVPVLAIDPQGDLVQFVREAEEAPGASAEDRALRRAFLDRVETRVWTPGSAHARRMSLNPLRLPGRDELEYVVEARREEEWNGMLAVASAQLVELARIGGEQSAQQTYLLQLLRGLTAGESRVKLDLERLVDVVSNPESVGVTDPDRFIKKAEREKLARKLNSLLHGPTANLYSGGEPLELDAMCRAEGAGKTPLNILYLNALADDEQKHFVVAAVAAEIYRWMMTSVEPSDRPNLLVYLDEARDFIPAGGSKPPAKMPLIRLFTQGRKYGVSCLLCTQSPRSVDYNVFGNCSTKLIGRLESAQDLDRVREWFTTGETPSWLNGRKGASKGSFVARWPDMPTAREGRVFVSRRLFTLHEGAWSPDRLERELQD